MSRDAQEDRISEIRAILFILENSRDESVREKAMIRIKEIRLKALIGIYDED